MKKLFGLFLLAVALLLTGCKHKHEWMAADCVTPQTCKECKKTQGEPLGHAWQEATCLEPKFCTVCGEIEGEPLGHKWQAATCTKPETCSGCGETKGEPIAHKWAEATCTQPQTCSGCGETKGEPLGHKEGNWELTSVNVVNATGKFAKTCNVCKAVVSETEDAITKLHDGKQFRFTPNDFAKRLQKFCTELSDTLAVSVVEEQGNAYMVAKDTSNEREVLGGSFLKGSTYLTSDKANSLGADVVAIQIFDANDIVLLRPVLCSLDPTLKADETGEKDFRQFLDTLISVGEASRNGITYAYEVESYGILLLAFAGMGDEVNVPTQEEHTYQDEILTEATYYQAGYKTRKCTKCGQTDGSKTKYYLWDKAYIRKLPLYSIYLIFDEDAKKVFYFTTDDNPSELTYTGSFNSGVTIRWDGWTEKFVHKTGSKKATLIDGNGFDWEYEVCDVEEAQKALQQINTKNDEIDSQAVTSSILVWISQSGSKYHSRKSCSGMKNPSEISKEEAEQMGYTPCKKCY